MYFYTKQTKDLQDRYIQLLSTMGALSNLFSISSTPYLDSRIAENVFCRALDAENISRQDCTADAKKGSIGIGIKTWIDTSKLQKIAEFNKARKEYINLSTQDFVYKIACLRNERIDFTKRVHGLNDLIYHCITRTTGKFIINESYMDKIDINSIQIISANQSSIKFKDKLNEYSFNFSKSVLMKQFKSMKKLIEIEIDIIQDPYLLLENCMKNNTINNKIIGIQNEHNEGLNDNYIILALYKYNNKTNNKEVPLKSGLNQWNAGGRQRDINEVYIPINRRDHKLTPNFFPARNQIFTLILPDGQSLKAKICQDGDKALMSNPNKALGKWLLRDVLNLKENTVVTYDMLEDLGIDAVKIEKINELIYKISFAQIGSYEEFIENKKKNI